MGSHDERGAVSNPFVMSCSTVLMAPSNTQGLHFRFKEGSTAPAKFDTERQHWVGTAPKARTAYRPCSCNCSSRSDQSVQNRDFTFPILLCRDVMSQKKTSILSSHLARWHAHTTRAASFGRGELLLIDLSNTLQAHLSLASFGCIN